MKKLIVVIAVLTAGLALASRSRTGAQGQTEPSLAGTWEGSVLDARRPYFVTAEFAQDKATGAWTGKLSVAGNPDAPVENISINGSKVTFTVVLRQGKPVMEGELRGDELSGTTAFRSGPTNFKLTRLPALAPPKDRTEAWQQDIDAALRFPRYDRSFTPAALAEYRKRLAELKTRIASLNDQQIFVELAKAVALGNNGHTQVVAGRSSLTRPPFPLQVAWFKDGLFVVRAAPAYANTLGCKVAAIDGRATQAVQQAIGPIFGGTAEWIHFRSQQSFVRPEVLYGAGVTKSLEEATYSLECADGKREVQVASDSNAGPGNQADWASPFKPETRPLYLRNRDKNYWFEYLPDSQVLYFQFNSSLNGGNETIPQFGERLIKELEEKNVRAVVIDMRFNPGGNLDIGESTIDKIRNHPKVQGKNKLFVITSNNTFSAAIFHASQLRQNPDAVFVGEPVGDRLEFWAEGDGHVLPNSRLMLRSSNGYHSYSKLDPPEFKPYFRDLSIDTLAPNIPVQPTYKDYASGRDVALDAILARLK